MKRRTIWVIALTAFVSMGMIACVDKTPSSKEPLDTQELTKNQPEVHGDLITAADVEITHPLNAQWVTGGKGIYEMKCQSCHKLTDEKLVGPGWTVYLFRIWPRP